MKNSGNYNSTMGLLQVIGILMVIMGHMGCNVLTIENIFPYYSFHMPLFVFISGYFYKQANESALGRFILKKAKGLLLPFYIWSFVYLLIQTLLSRLDLAHFWTFSFRNWLLMPWISDQQGGFYIACWFLIALFLTETIYVLIRSACYLVLRKVNAKKQWIFDLVIFVIFLALSCFIIQYRLHHECNGWRLVLLRSAFLLLFYHVGYCYKTYLEKWDKLPNVAFLLICVAIRCALLLKGNCDFGVYNISFAQPPLYTLAAAFTGIAFWLRIARILAPAVGDSRFIRYCSSHTKDCVIHHLFILYVISLVLYVINRKTGLFNSFHVQDFKTNVYYKYAPFSQFRLLYSFLTFGGSLLIARLTELAKRPFRRKQA